MNIQQNSGYVEFVARPVGYDNQVVNTKSTAEGDIETKIYSCYLLVFNTADGNLIYNSGNLVPADTPVTSIPTQRLNIVKNGVESVKACFIVNVPDNFINNADGTPAIANTTALSNAVLNSTHFTYATHSNTVPMGTPEVTIGGVKKQCIPAYGETTINLKNGTIGPVQISIKRLFAKVSVNLQVQLNLSGTANNIQTLTHYELQKLSLYNLPTMVKLIEDSTNESAWRTTAGLYSATPMQKSGINTKIYNKTDLSSNLNLSYTYFFYVPEFYLNPKVDPAPTLSQEYKPVNFPNEGTNKAYPIFIELEGSFVKYSINSATTTYKIYLGGNPIDDYSLARNTHYVNDLTIQNTNKNISGSAAENTLDHRVSTTTINNPVAKAGKAANCYVISQPGDYRFPAYMGAYNNLQHAVPCEGGVDVEILVNKAQLEGFGDITSINISNEAYDPATNMISFSVAKAPVVDMVPNGNVVIALVDKDKNDASRKIIWSWHLWFCTDFSGGSESEWATMGTHTYPNGSVMMDRNLGATSSISAGLYYKYNSKNPYVDDDYYGGGSNGTPTWIKVETYTKDDGSTGSRQVKAVHDPCPPGYMVPHKGAWDIGTGKSGSSSALFVYNLVNPNVTLYYNGYLTYDSSSKSYSNVSSLEENRNYTLDNYEMEPLDLGNLFPSYINVTSGRNRTRTRVDDETRYYDFVYEAKTSTKFGRFWYSNGESFHYENTSVDWSKILEGAFVIKECKTVKYKKYQNEKSSNYGVTWSPDGDPYYGDYQYDTKTSGFTAYVGYIYARARGTDLGGTNSKHEKQADHGQQIRCIKE